MTSTTTLSTVQSAVRGLLDGAPGYHALPALQREDLARRMVQVGMLAADLVEHELRETPDVEDPSPPMAAALASGADFGAATRAGTQTLLDAQKAIDFPRFVTSLISGTFQAITGSNIQQLEALSSMLDNVTASADQFSAENVNDTAAVSWAAQKFPFLMAAEGELTLRDDAVLTDHAATLKSALGASDSEVSKIDQGDLTGSLLPLIRRKLGRDRQSLLATIVQLGLQRIVVDQGQLHASMDLRVDASSVAEQSRRDRDEFGISTGASASFGAGAWGASARMDMSFSKVHAEDQYARNEVGLRAGLRSSVDLAFRTETVPLDRMAAPAARVKIDATARVPAGVADASGSVLNNQSRVETKPLEPTFKPPPAPVAPAPPGEGKKLGARVQSCAGSEERFDVWYDVPLVGQQSGMSCWAAGAAMVVAWRDCLDVDPEDVAKGAGRWAEYRDGLLPDDVESLARAFGLVVEAPRTYGVAGIREKLERCGPLWMGEASPGLHVIVLSGLYGDGSRESTFARICDPWPRERGERYVIRFSDLLANFRAVESVSGVQARILHCGEGAPVSRGKGRRVHHEHHQWHAVGQRVTAARAPRGRTA